jgi:hypothetical protein
MDEMKTAILVISNPDGGDESLARLVNALALAHEAKTKGDQTEVAFIGTGTRWPERLSKLGHPANPLYNEIRELIVGASCACSARWDASAGVESAGHSLISDNKLPGTPGALSVRRYLAEGWQTLLF